MPTNAYKLANTANTARSPMISNQASIATNGKQWHGMATNLPKWPKIALIWFFAFTWF